MTSILVLGATSEIARAVCREFATPEATFALVARDEDELDRCAADLRVRSGCVVSTHTFDARDFMSHSTSVEAWCSGLKGPPDGVVVCHGHLPDGELAATDASEALLTMEVNLLSVISLLTPLAERMSERGSGWIVGVASVAGDRGRQSNYVYGASKAGMSTYLQGLRNRLLPRGVHVLTVQPGFVDTRMLRSQMDGSSPLIATPARVARDIARAVRRRQDVLYTPWFWRAIMFGVRSIPERVFKRMRM